MVIVTSPIRGKQGPGDGCTRQHVSLHIRHLLQRNSCFWNRNNANFTIRNIEKRKEEEGWMAGGGLSLGDDTVNN